MLTEKPGVLVVGVTPHGHVNVYINWGKGNGKDGKHLWSSRLRGVEGLMIVQLTSLKVPSCFDWT